MGFYDTRCMVTGLIIEDGATLVLLQPSPDGYRPVSLGLPGSYNGLGCVDGVGTDPHSELIFRYFEQRRHDGRFRIESEPEDVDDLLWYFERNQLPDVEPMATLDGHVIVFALIAQPVWDALATGGHGRYDPGEIYAGRLDEFAAQAAQLASIDRFVDAPGYGWAPPSEPAQRYPTDMGAVYGPEARQLFLDQARRDLGHVEALRPLL